jgi:endonuclease G
MILRTNIVDAAEQRKPPEVTQTISPRRIFSTESLPVARALVAPPRLISDAALAKRTANLAFGGAQPSATELERLIGSNDLVDEFYLQRALIAAQPVMRITLREPSGGERGWATGVMVSPRLLLTNWHVFPQLADTVNAVAEAHYVLDIAGNPAPSYRFTVRGDQFYFANAQLDFALVAVHPVAQDGLTPLAQFGYHRLLAEPNKITEGECITLIQHPGGERRQFAIRENQLVRLIDHFLWYQSDTAPGSSGAPAFNDSFQVVGLHHSGAALKDEDGRYVLRDGSTVDTLDGVEESQVVWVANEGLRISVLCAFLNANLSTDHPYVQELFSAMQGGDVMSRALQGSGTGLPIVVPEATAGAAIGSNGVLTIPLQMQISLSMGAPGSALISPVAPAGSQGLLPDAAPAGLEGLRYPYVDRDYSTRTGYDDCFLGVEAPLPSVSDLEVVSRTADEEYVIPYEHFSLVLHKQRRLALFTAANADFTEPKRRPEPGDYSRNGLNGFTSDASEKWFTDPRIPQADQLPDVFYTKDGGSFDKGHIVRRVDMCWGDSYALVQRANGDTFHVTNCSPQISGFNQSSRGEDNWGDLENMIQQQADAERISILAGPIFEEDDPVFEGKDDFGPVRIQIPREFWKVILANDEGSLAAYAFVLRQELVSVPLEFSVTPAWVPYLVSVAGLEERLSGLTFPSEIHAADRSSDGGQEVAAAVGIAVHDSLEEEAPPVDTGDATDESE